MPREERCCHLCRAIPGACGLKRNCPCHTYRPSEDYMPEDPTPPETEIEAPIFVRPFIKPRTPMRPTPGTNPFRARHRGKR